MRALKYINVSHNTFEKPKYAPYMPCNKTYEECNIGECKKTSSLFCPKESSKCFYLDEQKCNHQTVDTFDLSDVGEPEGLIQLLSGEFFTWIQFEKIHLRNNEIKELDANWKIFSKSLEVLDLRQNNIKNLKVSAISYTLWQFPTTIYTGTVGSGGNTNYSKAHKKVYFDYTQVCYLTRLSLYSRILKKLNIS